MRPEGLVWAVRDAIYRTEPVKEKGVVCDYQEVMVDGGIKDKRLLVIESEFASTLKVMAREGNTLSSTIRQAWDSGHLRILTKTSPAKSTGAHISIVGHITAEELKRYLDSTESANGFANRFLWCCVRRSQCLPDGGQISTVDFAPILRCLSACADKARHIGELKRDTRARELWHEVYPALRTSRIVDASR